MPESFSSWRRLDLEMEGIEVIWIEIRFQKKEVLMCTAYRPPGASWVVIERICEMFEGATQEGKEMIVMGNFNCNVLHPESCTQELMLAADVCNLKHLITTPTHITSNSEPLIDLLLVTHPDSFLQIGCLEVTDSGHLMIFGVYSEAVKVVSHCVKKVRSFKKCDREKLCCEHGL